MATRPNRDETFLVEDTVLMLRAENKRLRGNLDHMRKVFRLYQKDIADLRNQLAAKGEEG